VKQNLKDLVKRVLDKEVGFLMEKDKERLAEAIAKAINEKYYSVSYN